MLKNAPKKRLSVDFPQDLHKTVASHAERNLRAVSKEIEAMVREAIAARALAAKPVTRSLAAT